MFLLSIALGASPLETTLAPLVTPALEADALQGVAVGLLSGDRTEVFSYGNVKPSDSFEIGSVSKGITGLLLAEALRRNELKLDDPAAEHLPFALPTYKGHAIRVEHLAIHTSGLPRIPELESSDFSDPYREVDAGTFAAFFENTKLEGEPGTHYAYSNLGAALLGRVLSEAAGKPYEVLVSERIFGPLGMKHSSIDGAKLTRGHDADGLETPPWTLSAFAPAGGIESTAEDMIAMVAAAVDGQHPLAATFALATQQHESLGMEGGIGLGWHITPAGVVWHNGQTGGFHSLVAFHPQRQLGVVVLGNTATPLIDGIGFGMLEVLAGKQVIPETVQKPVSIPASTLKQHVGQWGPATVAWRKDALTFQLPGERPVRLWPSAADTFFLRAADATVTFEGGQLRFQQNGVPTQTWSRIP